jgi:ADP-ribosylglycohydrolase
MDNYVYHTLFAGWCADAAGARLMNHRFDLETVKQAMRFEGTSNIEKGEYTDDTEMEICLMNGLIDAKDEYPTDKIAKNYIEWLDSGPSGLTTRNAIQGANNEEDMVKNALDWNIKSESNGLMMRCVPIPIFFMQSTFETLSELVQTEAQLTHPSKTVQEATTVYCFMISRILWCKKIGVKLNRLGLLSHIRDRVNDQKVLDWMNEGMNLKDISTYDCLEGHIKHAFILTIYFFLHLDEYTYEEAIQQVLMLGGKTNAKIIGSLFGAYYGDCVPEYMSKPVLESKSTRPYRIEYALERMKLFKSLIKLK